MRIAVVHTFYQQRGGEDVVVEQEVAQLRAAGHQVSTFFVHNHQLQHLPRWWQLAVMLWNGKERARFARWLAEEKCQIVHLHNTFPYLSPSILSLPHRLGLPLVVTLHNYRLACPAATFFRSGSPCHLCQRRCGLFFAVRHRCYRNSGSASFAVALLLVWSRLLRCWSRHVDLIFLFHPLQQRLLGPARLAPDRVAFKANSVASASDRTVPPLDQLEHDFLVVGRLSPEKGIVALAQWWRRQDLPYRLTVVGGGEDSAREQLTALAAQDPRIRYHGPLPQPNVAQLMRKSRFLVFPSRWYEGMPMVLLEAFAQGLPVLARRLGAASFLIAEGRTGFFFDHERDLAGKIPLLALIKQPDYQQLCRHCQHEQRRRYSHGVNVRQLEHHYRALTRLRAD